MTGKYQSGTRVRIRDAEQVHGPFSDVRRYRDETGEVIGSTALVAYLAWPWADQSSLVTQSLQVYRVRLDTGIEIDYVVEECLEVFEDS